MIFLSTHYGHLIRVLHWCTDQTMTHALEEMDLTASQSQIMGYLFLRKDPPCPRDVEEAFHLSHPTVSGILSRLEQKGFLELRTDPKDRRYRRIYVLPKGEACHQLMHSIITRNEQKLVQGFSAEEQSQFAIYLQRAISNMGCHACQHPPKEETNE